MHEWRDAGHGRARQGKAGKGFVAVELAETHGDSINLVRRLDSTRQFVSTLLTNLFSFSSGLALTMSLCSVSAAMTTRTVLHCCTPNVCL